jgi:hypothetical protein
VRTGRRGRRTGGRARRRDARRRARDRRLAAALIPLAIEVDALITVGALAALLCRLIAFEAIRFREARTRIRRAVHA